MARRDLVAFEPGDAGDLAVKLRTLLALSPYERAELGRAAGSRPPLELGGNRGSPAGNKSQRLSTVTVPG